MSGQGESEKVDICPDSCHSSRTEFLRSADAWCDSQGGKKFQLAALKRAKQEKHEHRSISENEGLFSYGQDAV